MDVDFKSMIAGLSRSTLVSAQRSAAAASAPTTASDPTGVVTVTAPDSGLPIVEIGTFWSTTGRAHAKSATAVDATMSPFDGVADVSWPRITV